MCTAAAQSAGRFDADIVPLSWTRELPQTDAPDSRHEAVTLHRDEGHRPDTIAKGLTQLKPVRDDHRGQRQQLSDGASACVVMSGGEARRRGLEPLGIFRGFAVADCEPDEMGIGGGMGAAGLFEIA